MAGHPPQCAAAPSSDRGGADNRPSYRAGLHTHAPSLGCVVSYAIPIANLLFAARFGLPDEHNDLAPFELDALHAEAGLDGALDGLDEIALLGGLHTARHQALARCAQAPGSACHSLISDLRPPGLCRASVTRFGNRPAALVRLRAPSFTG